MTATVLSNETWQRWVFVLLTATFLTAAAAPVSAGTQAVIRGTILRVTGDDLPNDIAVAIVGENFQVTASGAPIPIEISGMQSERVRGVRVDAGDGDDVIRIDASLGTLPASLFGGDGNDTLIAHHDGNSLLVGGEGNDVLEGGRGDDLLYGGLGNDELNGGAGQDTIIGDAGDDTLNGGGHDGQPDVLVGGTGADTFFRHTGENDLIVDFDVTEGDVFVDIA